MTTNLERIYDGEIVELIQEAGAAFGFPIYHEAQRKSILETHLYEPVFSDSWTYELGRLKSIFRKGHRGPRKFGEIKRAVYDFLLDNENLFGRPDVNNPDVFFLEGDAEMMAIFHVKAFSVSRQLDKLIKEAVGPRVYEVTTRSHTY